MRIQRTTEKHKRYWKNRKIDWRKQYQNANHPHRLFIAAILKNLEWGSCFELGCGAGANLINLVRQNPGKMVGGADISKDAIDVCNKTFKGGVFKVSSADDIMMSDEATDIALSDMLYIYVGPAKISKYVEELKRITRNYVLLCEFHHKSFLKRFWLRWRWGYNAYNWENLLKKHQFDDIRILKVPVEVWPEEPQQTFAHIIMARAPKK